MFYLILNFDSFDSVVTYPNNFSFLFILFWGGDFLFAALN